MGSKIRARDVVVVAAPSLATGGGYILGEVRLRAQLMAMQADLQEKEEALQMTLKFLVQK